MKHTLISLALTATLLASSNSFAVNDPEPMLSDSRILTVNYSPDNVVPIYGSPLITTQIVFGDDESITLVEGGDNGAWSTSIPQNATNMLFIKPTAADSSTNMTVITDKHTYYFHMEVKKNKSPTYAVHFRYSDTGVIIKGFSEEPSPAQVDDKKADASNNNSQYSFSGDKRLAPIHVFDDGKFTYLQFPPNQTIPAVFAVHSANGHESVVNIRQQGKYLVVEEIAPQFTLRNGDIVASIFNDSMIAKLHKSKWFF